MVLVTAPGIRVPGKTERIQSVQMGGRRRLDPSLVPDTQLRNQVVPPAPFSGPTCLRLEDGSL